MSEKKPSSRAERAAAITKKQAQSESRTRFLIAAVVVVLVGAIIGAGIWFGQGGTTASPGKTATPKAVADGPALVVGDKPDAPLKVVVYEDFLCPYCREFESSSRDFLRKAAAQGKVLVEYRPFQLLPDDYSKRALNAWSAVLEKGTPAQALKFHDLLYDKQPYENDANKPGQAQLEKWATSVGAPKAAVTAMGTENTAFYDEAEKAAKAADVQGTPTILVNGKQLTGQSVDDMASNLESMIAEQK